MRSAHSGFVARCGFALALVIAAGCSGGPQRSGFDNQTQDTSSATDPNAPAGTDGTSGGFGGGSTASVTLDPKNVTVIIDSATTPATPGSTAFKVSKNGADVTAGAMFTLKDPSLGSFAGATFTSVAALPAGVMGKSTTVAVQSSAGQALGTLTVVQLRKTGDQRDFFFIVPYGEDPTPKSDVLKFSTNIKQADVAFVMDTTGSMAQSIGALQSALSGTLLAQLQAAIPNVGLAVVDYKDFGQSDPWGVLVRQTITTNLAQAKTAVNAMTAIGGGDEPEAQVGAMYFALTGAANNGSPALAAHVPATPGAFGGVDFRPGSVPVVVNISDASWHDPSGNASIAGLKAAFASTKAKFVNVADSSFFGTPPETQPNDLSDATGSSVPPSAFGSVPGCSPGQCCTGLNGAGRATTAAGTCRLNFLSSSGGGVSGGIVSAIQAIAVGSTFDVTATPSNDPKNPGGVDATKFIKTLRAMDEGNPANGCPAAPAKDSNGDGIKDTFLAVKAGTPVCFEVIPAVNNTVMPGTDPQFFNAFIDVIAVQGDLHLDKRSVLFLVPPKDAGVK
ncbi:MAG: hypothetical protein JWO86_2003 [Myxococcaceae bacterium]|jgi:hypothetical protein|nr:hypothetical protein [Myxococcaceae bacterium]MEA2746402.1 hypothetical protein [Myxococcales bacterium]